MADQRDRPRSPRRHPLGRSRVKRRAVAAAAAVFGVLNTILKPILRLITLPLAIVTFDIAWFFVSLFMILLTEAIVTGFKVHGSRR